MDWKNEGITWAHRPIDGSKYAGTKVTAENRRGLIREKAYEYKSKHDEATPAQCLHYAKEFVNREKRHEKAFIENKNYFWYKGKKWPVMTESRLERFKQMATQLEDKFSTMDEEEKGELFINEEE